MIRLKKNERYLTNYILTNNHNMPFFATDLMVADLQLSNIKNDELTIIDQKKNISFTFKLKEKLSPQIDEFFNKMIHIGSFEQFGKEYFTLLEKEGIIEKENESKNENIVEFVHKVGKKLREKN